MSTYKHAGVLKELFEFITSYIQDNYIEEKELINFRSPSELKKDVSLMIDDKGLDENDLLKEIKTYLKYSVKTGNKQFLNQLYSGFTLPGFMAEIITALTNTSMYTYEVAPLATLIEKEVIDKMCKLAEFTDGSGTFVTGGSNANLIAMFSARNKINSESKYKGLYNSNELTAFVSDQAHYSFKTAANLIGIGADNLIKVKSNEKGEIIPEVLEKLLIKSLQEGKRPFFIAGTAGTTMLGAFDDFEKIAEIAEKYNCRFHIDGSFGGSVILSKNKRHLLKGLDSADSFAWNPHKLMNVPLVASVILLKDKTRLFKNLTDLDTDYIYHDNEISNFNLGKQSVQCGRRVDALKVWLAWKYFGDKGYEKRIDKMFELAEYATQIVQSHPNLKLIVDRQSLSICFRYVNKSVSNIDELNMEVRENLMKKGISLVNYGYINNRVAIRLVISNADINKTHLDTFFENYTKEVLMLEKKFMRKIIAA